MGNSKLTSELSFVSNRCSNVFRHVQSLLHAAWYSFSVTRKKCLFAAPAPITIALPRVAGPAEDDGIPPRATRVDDEMVRVYASDSDHARVGAGLGGRPWEQRMTAVFVAASKMRWTL